MSTLFVGVLVDSQSADPPSLCPHVRPAALSFSVAIR